MTQLEQIRKACGWFALGLLLTLGLINLIGLISPFWGAGQNPVHVPGGFHSRDLLHFWQPIVCWFAICFVVGAWHLARALKSGLAQVATILLGVLVAAAYITPYLLDGLMQQYPYLFMASTAIGVIALVAFPVIFWSVLRRQQPAAV